MHGCTSSKKKKPGNSYTKPHNASASASRMAVGLLPLLLLLLLRNSAAHKRKKHT
jgi:hypothetical protein